jgi:polyisoprenyl-teichoic acid--peptidoglycan teichoic acid transferase
VTNRPRSEHQSSEYEADGEGATHLHSVRTFSQKTTQSPIEPFSPHLFKMRPPIEPVNLRDRPISELETKAALPEISETRSPQLKQTNRKQRKLPWGKFLFATTTAIAIGGGFVLAKIAPIHNLDWMGLIKGRNPQEVFVEALGRKLDRPLQILVLGIDRVPGARLDSPESFNGRSDTMLLIRFDPIDRSLTSLSIPRDTQVPIPGAGRTKINGANVYGGAALTQTVVSQTLNDVNIDRYVRVDAAGLIDLVDALGGLEINVPKRMRYVDKTQKLNIDLKPGLQILNGTQVEGFVRFRNDEEGDIGRIRRTQVLIKALKAKLTNPALVLKLNDLMTVLNKHIDTNLSFEETIALGTFALTLKPDRVESYTLTGRPSEPGEFRYSYWIITPEDVAKAIDGKFQVKRQDDSNNPVSN